VPPLLRAQGDAGEVFVRLRGDAGRVRHARRDLRDADADPDRQDRALPDDPRRARVLAPAGRVPDGDAGVGQDHRSERRVVAARDRLARRRLRHRAPPRERVRPARAVIAYYRAMTMDGNDAARLARIAEQAMRERGFLAHPTPEAIAEAAGAREPDGQLDGVRDLRALPWTSIDNPESQDLDQIEAAEAADGGTRLYVGIADVDHFVRAGSAIDRAAGTNTTSVYTGVRTFPMLPERLSFDLSSLLQARRRPALVIETLIAADGSIVAKESKMYPALVENRAKLDYPSVSAWLDGHAPAPAPLANEP